MRHDVELDGDAVTRQAERLQTLHSINRAILAAESVEDIALEALSRIRALVSCDRAAIGIFDWTTRESLVFAVDVDPTEADTTGVRYPMDDLAEMLDSVSNDAPFLIEDMLTVDPLPPVLERYRAEGLRSNLQVALISVARPIGLLSLMSSRPRAFAPGDIEVVGEIAALLAIAIQQADARRSVVEHQRMKTELLSLLAHELFTPIATIQGTALTLLNADELPKDLLAGLTSGVEHAAARLKRLVGNISASARLENRMIEMSDVPVEVEEILEAARAEFDFDDRIRVRDPDGVAECMARLDLELVSHALVILLENALDLSGGQTVEVGLSRGAPYRADITVTDRGPGIPEDRHERVFELFEQVDSSMTRTHEGLGIGLFLARRIARASGGDIDIVPTEGDGVTFRLCLPILRSRYP
jgi:signal transduction histidine kinase